MPPAFIIIDDFNSEDFNIWVSHWTNAFNEQLNPGDYVILFEVDHTL
jgi:hypothetical protein